METFHARSLRGGLYGRGFVGWQEGFHTGVLSNGNFVEAHWNANPGSVFESNPLMHFQRAGSWETATIIVPAGTFSGEQWRMK